MTLIADGFLAGSLLSLLLPVALLIALVVWYLKFIRRVPEPVDGEEAVAGATASNPGHAATPAVDANPAAASGGAAAVPPKTSQHPGEI